MNHLHACTHVVPSVLDAWLSVSACRTLTVLSLQVQSPSCSLSLSCSQMDFFPFHSTNGTFSLHCAACHRFGDILDVQIIIFSHPADLKFFHGKERKSMNSIHFFISPWYLTKCFIHRVGPQLISAELNLIF